MKSTKKIISSILFLSMILCLSLNVLAAETISIDSVSFQEYIDEFGMPDDTLVTVKVTFTIPTTSEQTSILLASENISEISETTKPKIIYMSQDFTPDDNIYEFTVEKSRIESATGLSEIDGCTLYVKLGGKEVSEMATTTVQYYDPTTSVVYGDVTGEGDVDIGDAIKILRYDAKLETLTSQELVAGEVTGDDTVDIGDAIKILRYDAKLETTLK